MADVSGTELASFIEQLHTLQQRLAPLQAQVDALNAQIEPLENQDKELRALIDIGIEDFDGYADRLYATQHLLLKVIRKGTDVSGQVNKRKLYDKIMPVLAELLPDLHADMKVMEDEMRRVKSRRIPSLDVVDLPTATEGFFGRAWAALKSSLSQVFSRARKASERLDGVLSAFDELVAADEARRRDIRVKRTVREKLEGAEVLDSAEYGDYGIVVWKRTKGAGTPSEFDEYGTHEYRCDSPNAWYSGHYFGGASGMSVADAEKAARKDFSLRVKRLREAKNMSGKRRRMEKKSGLDVRAAKGVDSTKVDKNIGPGSDENPIGNPDKPVAPKITKAKDANVQRAPDKKLTWYAAVIDGKEIDRVPATSSKEAKDLLAKSLQNSATRRAFYAVWVDQGSKVVAAGSSRSIGYSKKHEARRVPHSGMTIVEVCLNSRADARRAAKALEGKDGVAAVRLADGNDVSVDVQASKDDAFKLVLNILGDEGFDVEDYPEPEVLIDEPAPDEVEDEVYGDEGVPEGRSRGGARARVLRTASRRSRVGGFEEWVRKVVSLRKEKNEDMLYEKLIGLSEELDRLIARRYEK